MADFNAGLLERGVLKASKFYPAVVHDEEAVGKTIQAIREVAPTLQR